jgi:hypothetical protein
MYVGNEFRTVPGTVQCTVGAWSEKQDLRKVKSNWSEMMRDKDRARKTKSTTLRKSARKPKTDESANDDSFLSWGRRLLLKKSVD